MGFVIKTQADRSDRPTNLELVIGEGRKARRLPKDDADTVLTFLRSCCDWHMNQRGNVTITLRDASDEFSRAGGSRLMISGAALAHYLASDLPAHQGHIKELNARTFQRNVNLAREQLMRDGKNPYDEEAVKEAMRSRDTELQAWLAPAVVAKLAAVLNK